MGISSSGSAACLFCYSVMANFYFVLCLVAILCLDPSQALIDGDKYDANCTSDSTGLGTTKATALDKWIRRLQNNTWARGFVGIVRIRLKDPNSRLNKLLGSAAADPKTWNGTEKFNFTLPAERTSMYTMNLLARVVGSTRTVIGYLWNYGFISKVLNLSKGEAENYEGAIPPCAVTNAIREFQLFNQIHPADGKLTKETIKKMAEERCGNLDAECETARCQMEDRYSFKTTNLRKKRFSITDKRKAWKVSRSGSYNVAYFYENNYNASAEGKPGHDRSMTPAVVKKEIEKGLLEWSKYSGITFVETNHEKQANVRIRFGSGAHGHGESEKRAHFDGAFGVLAHMYYPRSGAMHFDEAENFTAAHRGGINLHKVAAHEMGHGLGIKHSKVRPALMAPIYSRYEEQMMKEDDIKAIRALYGTGRGGVIPLEGDPIFPEGENPEEPQQHRMSGPDDRKERTQVDPEGCPTGDQVTPQQARDFGHCIVGFTAGFIDPNRNHIYLFYNENNYLRLETGFYLKFPQVSEPKTSFKEMLINEKFPGLEGPYDAAVTDEENKVTYFFSDSTVSSWDWATNQVDLNRVPIENTMFSGIPDPSEIDAVAKYYSQFVFFTAGEYYVLTVGEGVSGPFKAELNGEQIASAFHSFYNGYVYITTDNYSNNNIYNLVKAKKVTPGAKTARKFHKALLRSYYNINMDDDTMFGWPCGLGFCGTEIDEKNKLVIYD